MKLVLLYGPPGVGKLTVAKALSEVTGLKLLHNHLIADLVRSIFDYGNNAGREVNSSIRTMIYETTARTATEGLISTFSYYGDISANNSVMEWVNAVRKHGGEIYFVRLSCTIEELERRIQSPSRTGTKKVTDVGKLRKIMQDENPCMEIPKNIIDSFHIDNTNLLPEDTALTIRRYCELC